MTPERYQRIGQLFDAALERPMEERSAYLDHACGADAELRSDVERLLARHRDSGDFLSRPAIEVAAKLLAKGHAPLAPGKQISHYQILSLLGTGGMGEVYLAEDTRLKRKVALKVLPEALAKDQDRLRRFEQEAFAASALNHPNILTIYEFGAEGDTRFLAAEFVDGETMRGRSQREPISIKEALDVSVQAAQALGAAHRAGIIHRDIKPENVMIRDDGIVKVLDFGLAKLIESAPVEAEAETRMQRLTQAGTIVGTVAYMSPEQARGRTLDARSDIFSLGVVLYEMLTRRHPFIGETMSHTMVAILEREPLALAEVVSNAPAELEQIVDKALAKKADERYQSAEQLLADLKALQKRLELAAELVGASQEFARRDACDPRESGPRESGPRESGLGESGLGESGLGESVQDSGEAKTQIIAGQSTEPDRDSFRGPMRATDPDRGPIRATDPDRGPIRATDPDGALMRATTVRSSRYARLLLFGGLVVWIVLGVAAWRWLRLPPASTPGNTPAQVDALAPERSLTYSLTVQKYRDGKPYQEPFQSSGREIFEGGWKFKLDLMSPQEGFLYLLNQEPGDIYRLVFPSSSSKNGSAHIAANERHETDWYFFDDKTGTERFRLVWAAEPLPELETLRELVNKTTKGLITNPTQIKAVREFLQQNEASQIESDVDQQTKQTNVRGRSPVLVTLIQLEHH